MNIPTQSAEDIVQSAMEAPDQPIQHANTPLGPRSLAEGLLVRATEESMGAAMNTKLHTDMQIGNEARAVTREVAAEFGPEGQELGQTNAADNEFKKAQGHNQDAVKADSQYVAAESRVSSLNKIIENVPKPPDMSGMG